MQVAGCWLGRWWLKGLGFWGWWSVSGSFDCGWRERQPSLRMTRFYGGFGGGVAEVLVVVRPVRFAPEVLAAVGHNFFLGNLVFCCSDYG